MGQFATCSRSSFGCGRSAAPALQPTVQPLRSRAHDVSHGTPSRISTLHVALAGDAGGVQAGL